MTRRRPTTQKPVEVQQVEIQPAATPTPAPIPFPAANRENALVYMRQMKQAENQMKGFEHQANLIIDATAIALNIGPGWRLDMRGEMWQFVPPPDEREVLEIADEPQ